MGRKGLNRFTNYTGNPVDTIVIITTVVVSTIAAFAWRDYSESLFEKYFPKENPSRARLLYAVIATVIALLGIYCLGKVADYRTQKIVINDD